MHRPLRLAQCGEALSGLVAVYYAALVPWPPAPDVVGVAALWPIVALATIVLSWRLRQPTAADRWSAAVLGGLVAAVAAGMLHGIRTTSPGYARPAVVLSCTLVGLCVLGQVLVAIALYRARGLRRGRHDRGDRAPAI